MANSLVILYCGDGFLFTILTCQHFLTFDLYYFRQQKTSGGCFIISWSFKQNNFHEPWWLHQGSSRSRNYVCGWVGLAVRISQILKCQWTFYWGQASARKLHSCICVHWILFSLAKIIFMTHSVPLVWLSWWHTRVRFLVWNWAGDPLWAARLFWVGGWAVGTFWRGGRTLMGCLACLS